MPNWCVNRLEVSGPGHDVLDFKVKAHWAGDDGKDDHGWVSNSSSLSLQKLFPQPTDPDTLEAEAKDCYLLQATNVIGIENKPMDWEKEGWYYWRVNNWGTKWDTDGAQVKDNGDTLVYDFQTAWSPPIEAFQTISKAFPKLVFTLDYWEPGNGFSGMVSLKAGVSERQVELDGVDGGLLTGSDGEYINPGLSEEFFEMLAEFYYEQQEHEINELESNRSLVTLFEKELARNGFPVLQNKDKNLELYSAVESMLDYLRDVDEVFLEDAKRTTIHTLTSSLAHAQSKEP